MAEIRVENLVKQFGDFVAVNDVSLTIANGEFFVLLGPSGCGKTTTLRMIAGLEIPTGGRILLDGDDVTMLRASRRDIAFVFQLFALYPHMNVRRNISYPLRAQGMPWRERKVRIDEVARLLRITHLLDRPVSGLAGGDRQRVALGRAMVRRPKAFLMDEPLGTLDTEFRQLMCEELRGLHDRIEATSVYVTHDQIEALAMATRIGVMNTGRLEQVGPPNEIYSRPRSKFVAGFVGSPSMNFIPARGPFAPGTDRARVGDGEIAMPALRSGLDSDTATIGARPEQIVVTDTGALRGRVVSVEYMGSHQHLQLDTTGGRLIVRAPNQVRATLDETVGLDLIPDGLVLFDDTSGRAVESALFGDPRDV